MTPGAAERKVVEMEIAGIRVDIGQTWKGGCPRLSTQGFRKSGGCHEVA